MKILNIDDFAEVKRKITFKGVTHDVVETSVQQFINNLRAAEELEKAGGDMTPANLSSQIENSVTAICESVPTLKKEDLMPLKIEAIAAIMKFIRGDLDEAVSAPGPAQENGEQDTQKKN